jgi:hypothetical protein
MSVLSGLQSNNSTNITKSIWIGAVLMKQILLSICLLTLALAGNAGESAKTSDQPGITEAKAAIKELAGALQTELKSAMQTGGPVAAIAVCNTRAMPITEKIAAGKGMQLSRVSLKNRNPLNAPSDWQTAVLEDFEKKKSAGKDIATLTWSETVKVDGVQEFRFMKAIPTAPVCLKCHGTGIAPEISQILAKLYPEDQATGFSEGDIRGAFVVTRKTAD